MTHPMLASVESSIETSMKQPSRGRGAAHQRARDRKCGGDAAQRVGDRIADAQRRATLVARDAHRAGQALHDLIVRRCVFHRPVLTESGDRAVDERRIELAQSARIPGRGDPSRRDESSRRAHGMS